jgi:hypothetical protein
LEIYTVELYLKVRLACADGMSKRAAARHFNVSRDTVDKAMAFSIPPATGGRLLSSGRSWMGSPRSSTAGLTATGMFIASSTIPPSVYSTVYGQSMVSPAATRSSRMEAVARHRFKGKADGS